MSIYTMLYLTLSKLVFKSNNKMKVLLLGSVVYLLIHAIINSPRFSNNNIIIKYSKYLYVIWGLDLIAYYYIGKELTTLDGIIDDEEENNTNDDNDDNKSNHSNGYSSGEEETTPFIKKDKLKESPKELPQQAKEVNKDDSNDKQLVSDTDIPFINK